VPQNNSNTLLYLEDLRIGMEFVSREYRLDAEQIITFASQFDPQPFHISFEDAQHSFFKGLAASGWHTMAITMRLIVESVPLAGGIIGVGAELTWPRPTRPEDILRVNSTIVEIKPSKSKPGRAIVLIHCLTRNQNTEVLQDFTGKLLVFSKSQS
jgi:acyl dehydratase